MENESRIAKGYSILAKGDVPISINKETFLIPSQSGKGKYKVNVKNSYTCDCPDFKFRNVECKHITAVKLWIGLRNKINSNQTLEFEKELSNESKCVYCSSLNVKKNGSRKTQSGIKQRFYCEDCKKTFIEDKNFAKFKANPKIITLTLDLYYKGLSLRDITDTLNQFFAVKLHHETVRRWIVKFSKAMDNYTKHFTPKVSDVWHADEQMIKVKGKYLWNWNVLDEETRFLLANNITEKRFTDDARTVFQMAKETAKVKPDFVITDGLHAYQDAIRKEFFVNNKRPNQTKHVRLETLEKSPNNNLVERFHSTFRERDKVMRGFKTANNPMIDGFYTYYNFIRNHSTLGTTPSEKAGIDLNLGRNRWLSLLAQSLENKV